jgi:Bacterial PH domain
MRFSASYDRNTKIVSGIVCLGLLAVIVAVHNFVLTSLSLLAILLCFAYSPRGYELAGRSILVKRLAGTVRIPLDGLREARRATPDDFRGGIRLWGSGGLFGYYGLFSTTKLGKSTWYVTNRSNSVVVVTAAKTVLFSPDGAEVFLAAIRAGGPAQGGTRPLGF